MCMCMCMYVHVHVYVYVCVYGCTGVCECGCAKELCLRTTEVVVWVCRCSRWSRWCRWSRWSRWSRWCRWCVMVCLTPCVSWCGVSWCVIVCLSGRLGCAWRRSAYGCACCGRKLPASKQRLSHKQAPTEYPCVFLPQSMSAPSFVCFCVNVCVCQCDWNVKVKRECSRICKDTRCKDTRYLCLDTQYLCLDSHYPVFIRLDRHIFMS